MYCWSWLFLQNSLIQIGLIQIIIVKNSFRQSSSRQNSLQVNFARLEDLYTQATGIRVWAILLVDAWIRKAKLLLCFD
jgi:hypothetical protein